MFAKGTIPITDPMMFADILKGTGQEQCYIIGFNGEATIQHQNRSAHLISSSGRRRRANLIVRISLLKRTEMLEYIKRHLESRPCDLHMRCPATQLLIA